MITMHVSTPHCTQRCSPDPGPVKGATNRMESVTATPSSFASVGAIWRCSLQYAWPPGCSMQTSESCITKESATGIKEIGACGQLSSDSLKFSPSPRLNRVQASCSCYEKCCLHVVNLGEFIVYVFVYNLHLCRADARRMFH